MPPDEADGENLGIVKFGRDGAARLVEIMDGLVAAGGLRDWAPRAFRELAQVRPLHAVGTRGFPWIEIDFPADYQRAVREILPEIEGDRPAADDDVPLTPARTAPPHDLVDVGSALAAGDLR
jgi:choline kinase